MRCIVLALALLLTPPALADDTLPPNPLIQGTIQAQIDAFLRDDFATAFTFASPSIRGLFGTPENFGLMVRQGYPMVWRPSDVRMMELREVAGNLWQRVMVTDEAGQTFLLDYMMVQTADGWQINAVQLLSSVGVGA
jgi:hypothetical protein